MEQLSSFVVLIKIKLKWIIDHGGVVTAVTLSRDQLHQVVGAVPLQRLQSLDHLQAVPHAPPDGAVHPAEHGCCTHAQPVPHLHLGERPLQGEF